MRKDKRVKEKKKKRKTGKLILILILLIFIAGGAYLGYSISKNGGGLQGVLATVLGQDIDDLQDLDTINVLLLRRQRRFGFEINRHDYDLFL